MLGISSLLIDDPPALEVSDNNLGISGVQRVLAVHDFALAMVGSAHLVRLKSYSSKFLQLLTQRYEASSGLRPPSILEAQQADCKLWQLIYSLVQDKDWKLNDAIFEVTEVRGDVANLLQARPKPLLPLRPSEKGGKGKGALNRLMSDAWKGGLSEKGKSQGKDKGQKGKGSAKGSGPPWVKNVPILLNDQLHHQLLQGFHKACSPRLPGSNPRLPFERFHPRGKPKRCMLWSRPLLPMLFCSFLLQESHLVSLCPLEHSSSMAEHQLLHRPILASSSANSSSSPCFSSAAQHALRSNEGGSPSSFMPVQSTALQGGSSPTRDSLSQPRDAREQILQ